MRSSTNNKTELRAKSSELRKLRTGAFIASVLSFVFTCTFFFNAFAKPNPKVYIKKLKNSHYQLMVQGKPYIVKGVCYNPIPIGQNHEYDWWADPAKPWLADGKLMKEMGINSVRIYQTGENPEQVKMVIRDLYEQFGIRVALGSWLGFWEYPCPLYGSKAFQEKVKKEVLDMVNLYKDEPGVLFWILGNENNYSCLGRVNPWSSPEVEKEPDPQTQNFIRAKIYYSYVNDIAREIHKIDPNHPVALGNGELVGLDAAAKFAPDIDLIACIIYRGRSFGNLFNSLRNTFDRPIVLSEFGADAYDSLLAKEDQNHQAFFLEWQWRQIYDNLANKKKGAGNCLGGFIFEWTDEWWKHNEYDPAGWNIHDTASGWGNGSYYFDAAVKGGKNMTEEWFGIVSLSPGTDGLDKRIPRKAYYVIREFWKNPVPVKQDKKAKDSK